MAEVHKKGQGVLVRRVAFWVLALIIIWGTRTLYDWLVNLEIGGGRPLANLLLERKGASGYLIPVFDQRFDVAFVVTWGLTAAGLYVLWRILNRPRSAEFLIETDAELKKVTWPNWKDAWNSSVIVIVFVALLAVFLVASDILIGAGMGLIMGSK